MRLHTQCHVPAGALLIGCVGRLVQGKGQEILIDAFAKVAASEKSDQPGCRLILIGDGPERSALETQAARRGLADRVCFAGFLEDIPFVLSALDIVVVPSTTTELMPLAVMEAMAAGKAVIAANVGGVPEIISDASLGRLTPPGDTEALAAALNSLMEDAPLRWQLGTAAKAHVHVHFSFARLLDDTEALYSELMKNST